MSNLEQQAKQLMEAFTGVKASSINNETSLTKDLGLDSLKMAALSKVIEQVSGAAVPESTFSKFKMFGDILGFLQKSNVKDMNLSNITEIIATLAGGKGSIKDKLGDMAKQQGQKMVMDGLKKLFS